MSITIDDIVKNLEQEYSNMRFDDLEIGLVVHIGKETEAIGDYFAKAFDTDLVYLPSIQRKGKNQTLANILNSIYPYIPESILKILSYQYKRIYRYSERDIPVEISKDSLLMGEGDSPILLVDDNALTGSTLEMWKNRVEEITKRQVETFSVTVTGSYKPDYYCFEGWKSFEWRPIGI